MHQTGAHKLDPVAQPRPRFARVDEVVDREGLGFAKRRLQRGETKRVGCGVQDFDATKQVKFAAS